MIFRITCDPFFLQVRLQTCVLLPVWCGLALYFLPCLLQHLNYFLRQRPFHPVRERKISRLSFHLSTERDREIDSRSIQSGLELGGLASPKYDTVVGFVHLAVMHKPANCGLLKSEAIFSL